MTEIIKASNGHLITVDGKAYARILALEGGQGDMPPLRQAVVQALALRREEIQAVFVAVHHVDGCRHGQAGIVHRGNNGGVDHIGDIRKILF